MIVIRNATLPAGQVRDVRVDPDTGTIDAVGTNLEAEETIAADGARLVPGMVDVHVHTREPGAEHKETWKTASRSAAAGGVTTIVDQPNSDPPTIDGASFDQKASLASNSVVDFGINGGVLPAWEPDALFDRPVFALGEVFLADSTGDMGIDADLFRTAVERAAAAGVVVTVHAEDATRFDDAVRDRSDADAWSAFRTAEAEVAAVERAVAVATESAAQVHIAHASTPDGIDLATDAGLTAEVTPHHLLLSRDDLPDLGTYGRMNPPLRSEARRDAVYERVRNGTVDIIATDHAPHTRAEKEGSIWEVASGVPGVETALPLLLEEARQGRLSYERVRDLTAANPAEIFDLPGKGRIEPGRDADLVLVDPTSPREISGEDLHSTCDWTPFEGWTGVFPEWTMVRGQVVYDGRSDSFPDPGGVNVRGRDS